MANYAHISQSVVVVSLVRYIYPRKVALTCVERVKDLLLGLTHSNYNRSLYNLTIYIFLFVLKISLGLTSQYSF